MSEEEPLPRIDAPAHSLRDVLARFIAIVPAAADVRIGKAWCGLIDQSADALPVIQALPDPAGLVLATGFSGHGFCLGPVTGQILADLAEGIGPALPIAPFRVERFSGIAAAPQPVTLHG